MSSQFFTIYKHVVMTQHISRTFPYPCTAPEFMCDLVLYD